MWEDKDRGGRDESLSKKYLINRRRKWPNRRLPVKPKNRNWKG